MALNFKAFRRPSPNKTSSRWGTPSTSVACGWDVMSELPSGSTLHTTRMNSYWDVSQSWLMPEGRSIGSPTEATNELASNNVGDQPESR